MRWVEFGGTSSCRPLSQQERETPCWVLIPESCSSAFFLHFPYTANMRITFLFVCYKVLAALPYSFMPSAAVFWIKPGQLLIRSPWLHASSQIISSTPVLLTTDCVWNVSVPPETAAGARARGWVGSCWKCTAGCLHHDPRQQRSDGLFNPADTGWSFAFIKTWFAQSSRPRKAVMSCF